jgi:hypothetical protein
MNAVSHRREKAQKKDAFPYGKQPFMRTRQLTLEKKEILDEQTISHCRVRRFIGDFYKHRISCRISVQGASDAGRVFHADYRL